MNVLFLRVCQYEIDYWNEISQKIKVAKEKNRNAWIKEHL